MALRYTTEDEVRTAVGKLMGGKLDDAARHKVLAAIEEYKKTYLHATVASKSAEKIASPAGKTVASPAKPTFAGGIHSKAELSEKKAESAKPPKPQKLKGGKVTAADKIGLAKSASAKPPPAALPTVDEIPRPQQKAKRIIRISDVKYLGTTLKKETVFNILPDGREVFAETRYRNEAEALVTLDEVKSAAQAKRKPRAEKKTVPKKAVPKPAPKQKTVPKKAPVRPPSTARKIVPKRAPKILRPISGGERLSDWNKRAARMKVKNPPDFRSRPITKPSQLRPYEVRTKAGTASTLSKAQLQARENAAFRRGARNAAKMERNSEFVKRYVAEQKRLGAELRRNQAAQRRQARQRARSMALSKSRAKSRKASRVSKHASLYAAVKEARATRFNKRVPLPLAIKTLQQKGARRNGLSGVSAKRLAPFGTNHRGIMKELGWPKRSMAGYMGRSTMYPSQNHAAHLVSYAQDFGARFTPSFGAALAEPRLSFYEKMAGGALRGGGGLAIRIDATDVINNLSVVFPRNMKRAIAAASDTIGRKLLDIVEPYVPKDTGALYSSGKTEPSGSDSFGAVSESGLESFGVTISYNTSYAETVYFNENKTHGAEYNSRHGTDEKGAKETYRWIEKAFENEKGALNGLMKEFGTLVMSGIDAGAKTGTR